MKHLPEARNIVPATYVEAPYSSAQDHMGSEWDPRGLSEYWRVLRRRKGTVVLIGCVGGLMGLAVTIPRTPIYQTRTSLEIVGLNDNFLNSRQVNPLAESASSSDAVDIQTQIKILQTDWLLDRVVEKLKSAPLPTETRRTAAWRKALNLAEPEPTDTPEQAIAYARRNVAVRSAGQTRIIEVSIDSMSAEIAAAFARTLASEFIDQNLQSRLKTTEQTGAFLANQIDDVRLRLADSEEKLQGYARDAGLMFTDEKTNISEEKLRQLQATLSAAQADRITRQSRWEMARSSPAEALPDILNDPDLQEYQRKLTELHRRRAELMVTYTPEHAGVKRVEAEIATFERALLRERGNILKRIQNEYNEARSRERLLSDNYSMQSGVVTGEGAKAVQYNILKREVDSTRQLYDAMLQQLKQATLALALRASNIRVVDPAKVPKIPYKPNIPLSTAMGLLTGLSLGVGLVIILDRADRSIRYPGESTLYIGLSELGVIPSGNVKSRLQIWPLGQAGQAKLLGKPTLHIAPAPNFNTLVPRERVELITLQRKPSMIAESFRSTLASILFSGENGDRPRVMVVTSSNSAEGKSTVVSNLGIAVAEVNQDVLLIDADLRKPRLHDIFGLKNGRGLSDLLCSKDLPASLEQFFSKDIIKATSVPNLYVLTSGPTTAAATSLLHSARMSELLRMLRSEFEMILIDTPPMVQMSDARVLGRMADRVILVLRAGRTTRDAALAARQRLSEDGTQVLGTVLNGWDPTGSPNRYYGYPNSYE